MRIFLCLSLISLAVGNPQDGFFSGISGAFNNLFSGGNRRPPPARRPQQTFQQAAAPTFQQQPVQQQQFVPQQQQQQVFQQPAAPQFRPQQQQLQQLQQQPQQQQVFRQAAPASTQTIRGGTALCAAHAPNFDWTDPKDNILRRYVVTWKFDNPCKSFQQSDARAYCNSMGMEPVSLDSPAKQDAFNSLIASDAQRFFWTGGIVDHSQKTVFWSNQRSSPVPFSASAHWSHTGGAGLPQPDNRAAGETPPHQETCLGILNNFYADGIKWHDVACHHKKPTVCEPRS